MSNLLVFFNPHKWCQTKFEGFKMVYYLLRAYRATYMHNMFKKDCATVIHNITLPLNFKAELKSYFA